MDTIENETWCDLMACPHPSCWQAQRRVTRGTTQKASPKQTVSFTPRLDDIPTQKVKNLASSVFGPLPDSSGCPVNSGSRGMSLMEYLQSRARYSSAPSSASSMGRGKSPTRNSLASSYRSEYQAKVSTLEVQEVFDPSELHSEWQDNFNSRPIYVWKPNMSRRKEKIDEPAGNKVKFKNGDESSAQQILPTRDMTELLLPKTLEKENSSLGVNRPHRSSTSAATSKASQFYRTLKSSHPGSHVTPIQESVLNLLGLPANVLSDVLDQIEHGEFITQETINSILESLNVEDGTHENGMDSGPITSVLLQRKAKLHEGAERYRRPPVHYQSTQPFQMDRLIETLARQDPKKKSTFTSANGDQMNIGHSLPPILSVPRSSVRSVSVQCVPRSDEKPGPALMRSRTRPLIYSRPTQQMDLMLAPVTPSLSTPTASTHRTEQDSASRHMTASSDRSTLYQEILPSYRLPGHQGKISLDTIPAPPPVTHILRSSMESDERETNRDGMRAPVTTPNSDNRTLADVHSEPNMSFEEQSEGHQSPEPGNIFVDSLAPVVVRVDDTVSEKDDSSHQKHDSGYTSKNSPEPLQQPDLAVDLRAPVQSHGPLPLHQVPPAHRPRTYGWST